MPSPTLRSHFPLIAASLSIAAFIWLIAQQSNLESQQLRAKVFLDKVPDNVNVTVVPDSVPIMVKFPHSQRPSIVPHNFEVRVNIEEVFGMDARIWAGVNEPTTHPSLALTFDNVHMINLPQSVRVTEIGPNARIQIEARLVTRTIPIKVQTSGKPMDNFEVTEIRSDPRELIVTAPREVIARLGEPGTEISTAAVKLDGRGEDFIDYPALKLQENVLPVNKDQTTAQVYFSIREKVITQAMTDVPIQIFVYQDGLSARITPPAAEIRLKGKVSMLARVTPAMFKFSSRSYLSEEVGTSKEAELDITFSDEAPEEIRKEVIIEGFIPSKVSIEFMAAPPGGEEDAAPGSEPAKPAA